MIDAEITKLMQQGKHYLNSSDVANAKKCYLAVLQEKPTEFEANYSLGLIANHEQQVNDACEYFKKALSIQPLNKNCVVNLANLYNQLERYPEAITVFQEYLQLNSSKADVYYFYACVLLKVNEIDRAVDALQRSITLNPSELMPYMTLGEILYRSMQFRAAQQIYKNAFDRGLKSEGLYQNLAKLHTDHGELEQAKEILIRAVEDFPESLSFPYRLSSIDPESLTPALYEKLICQEGNETSAENLFYRYWLLALYAKQNGQRNAEMDLLIKAHALHVQHNTFSENADFYLKRLPSLELPLTAPITAQRDAESEKNPPETDKPIFIVGVPRCGSTLIENIICSGPERVLKGEEPSVILQGISKCIDSDSQSFWSKFQDNVKANYHKCKLLEEGVRFTDKSLENIFLIDFIMSLYPKAKIIYCDRTPLASIISIMQNNMVLLPWAHELDKIFEYVDNCLIAIDKWHDKYPDNIYTIKYEQLVTNQVEESKKLMAFCELPWDESCLAFHQKEGLVSRTASHMQIRNEINQNAVSTYQQYKSYFEGYEGKYPWMKQ